MAYKHKADQNAAARKWYRQNRRQHMAAAAISTQRMIQRYRDLKATYSCIECGETDPDCLTFHHRDRTQKLFNISTGVAQTRVGIKRLLSEIQKCDCLCANCHMKLEAKIRRGQIPMVREQKTTCFLPLFDIQ